MKTSIDLTLRDTEVTAKLTIRAPEPDVGLLGPWWDDLELFSESGDELTWALSEAEMEKISQAVSDHYYDSHSDWD